VNFFLLLLVNFSIFLLVRWIFVTKVYPKVMNEAIEKKYEGEKK